MCSRHRCSRFFFVSVGILFSERQQVATGKRNKCGQQITEKMLVGFKKWNQAILFLLHAGIAVL